MLAYIAPTIDSSGIHMLTYEDRLSDLCAAYRSIFGQEAELLLGVPEVEDVLFSVSGRHILCLLRADRGGKRTDPV